MNLTTTRLSVNGCRINAAPEALGWLRDSNDILTDPEALLSRFQHEGYLLLRNLLDGDMVMAARQRIAQALVHMQVVDASYPEMELRARAHSYKVMAEFRELEEVQKVARAPALLELFRALLNDEPRLLDRICTRVVGYNKGEWPHSDIVYLNRGTSRVITAWIPLGETPVMHGGLMLLEGSNRHAEKLQNYWRMDADRLGAFNGLRLKHGWPVLGGRYSRRPQGVQRELGGRWLVAHYQSGDVLLFNAYTMHCALDNQTDRYRLSIDARYQPVSEAVDPRWIGSTPQGHRRRQTNIFDLANAVWEWFSVRKKISRPN